MRRLFGNVTACLLALSCGLACAPQASKSPIVAAPAASAGLTSTAPGPFVSRPRPVGPPLEIAYSDWPGWVAWDIAVQKGWFSEAGVDVQLKWMAYEPSMDAFTAKRVDADSMTNGDALATGAGHWRGWSAEQVHPRQ